VKKKQKKATKKAYSLLMYVEDSNPKIKRFDTQEELGKFADKFIKDHPGYASMEADSWLDYAVTNIVGSVHFFTDGLEVE
jgi:hypothetical protein